MDATTLNINLFNIIATSMAGLLTVVYGLAAFWHFRFLSITQWQPASALRLMMGICCFLLATIYGYLFIFDIITGTIRITVFSALYLRPASLLLGAAIAANARLKIRAFRNGGEIWKPRKPLK